jgi:intergrase/recombinase
MPESCLLFDRTTIETFDVDGLTASGIRNSEEEKTVDIGIDDTEDVISWYAGFLKSLENRYAKSYDAVIRKLLGKDGGSSKEAKAVRTLLRVAGRDDIPLGGTDLFEKIHHPVAAVRAEAVHYLVKNYNSLQERDKNLACTALTARLRDDNTKVRCAP